MTVPVVLVGLELNGLGVARSLGPAGIPIVALDADPGRPSCRTRYARVHRAPALNGPPLIEALLLVRRSLRESPVLVLTQEASVATISRERSALEGAFRFSMPPDSVMRTLLDKAAFQKLAEEGGYPVPRAVTLRQGEEADLSALRFPCILKPTTRIADYDHRFRKAYRVTSREEILSLWRQMQSVAGEVIVQEWIEGDDADVYFCLQYRPPRGEAATSFVGRKIRQWPRLVGGTACCVPSPECAPELTAITERFFAGLCFVGLCSMEYKRDRRDGRFHMVEPTVGRTDFQEEIAALNGVNIPLAAYRGELGLPPLPWQPRAAFGWHDPDGDAKARAAGAQEVPVRLPLRDAYWRFSDPLPSLARFAGAWQRRLTRAWSRRLMARSP